MKMQKYTKEDFLRYTENGIVNIDKMMNEMNLSRWTIRAVCKTWNLRFKKDFSKNKIIKTKQCPVCSWSGNFQFKRHIIDSTDERHKKWIEDLIRMYKEGISYYNISEKEEFKNYNISFIILKDILDELNVLNRTIPKIIYKCPACDWQHKQWFLKHLKESNDDVHIQLKNDIVREYIDEKKNSYMVGEKFKVSGDSIKMFLKSIGKLRTHEESMKVSMETNRHNIDAYGISGKRKDLNNEHFRSIPEANYARILQYEGISFEREKHFIIQYPNGKRHAYYLDFLTGNNKAIEIKGYEDSRGQYKNQEKIELFKQQYPQYDLEVIFCNGDKWKQLYEKYSKLIDLWETPSKNLRTNPELYQEVV